MLPRNHPGRIRVSFDDHRLVANAGLLLPATLALRLGLGAAGGRKSGAARRARAMMPKKPKPVAPGLAGQGRRRRDKTQGFPAPRLPGQRRTRNPFQSPRRRRNCPVARK